MKQTKLLKAILGGLTITMMGCANDEQAADAGNSEETNTSNEENVQNDEESGSAYPMTITHELGETVIGERPEAVVVFDYGVADIMLEIGVMPTGVPQGNIPSYLDALEGDDIEDAGTLFEPDFEAIYGMDPDLIIISGRAADAYDDLSEIAPTLFVSVDTSDYMNSFEENARLIGDVFNETETVSDRLQDIQMALEDVKALTDGMEEQALILMTSEGQLSAYGPGSRFGIIHDDFGIPAADPGIDEANHGMNVSFEYVLETNPDYIFVMDRGAVVAPGEGETAQETLANDLVMNTTAYQKDQVIELHPEYWYISAGGLTSVSEMINQVKDGLK
ncbi:siderophore ABC transporter substrate-binding protein [Salisediminibacterium selenitireducens]|uniref:Periplasmic binding protein n=1 Tax=Bacillus selenitireducens (strain ATCC 700615 / DSM 15326 / MLS10) TaxID=439292 RepID=D6XZ27_BACIE|nr:siderophore ABC transporter substrate-binding protein [Salisediminibacterium selenitireducens]ADI00312.1 periplasmic binding protein [[Bacillus] selenitireducens MLS10]